MPNPEGALECLLQSRKYFPRSNTIHPFTHLMSENLLSISLELNLATISEQEMVSIRSSSFNEGDSEVNRKHKSKVSA